MAIYLPVPNGIHQGENMQFNKQLLLAVFIYLFSLCVFSQEIHGTAKVLSVSDYQYTMKGQQAVSVSFGKSETEFLTLTLLRKNIKQGYKHVATDSSDKELNITVTMPGNSYTLSLPEHKTGVAVEIMAIDKNKKTALIKIKSRLIDAGSMKMLTMDEMQLLIDGENFTKLVMQIK